MHAPLPSPAHARPTSTPASVRTPSSRAVLRTSDQTKACRADAERHSSMLSANRVCVAWRRLRPRPAVLLQGRGLRSRCQARGAAHQLAVRAPFPSTSPSPSPFPSSSAFLLLKPYTRIMTSCSNAAAESSWAGCCSQKVRTGLSVGLFAPGWTLEDGPARGLGGAAAASADLRFWASLGLEDSEGEPSPQNR